VCVKSGKDGNEVVVAVPSRSSCGLTQEGKNSLSGHLEIGGGIEVDSHQKRGRNGNSYTAKMQRARNETFCCS
jgi:hypothetical protein